MPMLFSRHCWLLPPFQAACRQLAPLAVLPQLSATIPLVLFTILYQPLPSGTNCHCRLVLPLYVHCLRPEPDATLQTFYRRVRPHGRGWATIAAATGAAAAPGSLGAELFNAFLGCVLVYSALFGVGQILLRSAAVGIALLLVSALAAFAIARNLQADEAA